MGTQAAFRLIPASEENTRKGVPSNSVRLFSCDGMRMSVRMRSMLCRRARGGTYVDVFDDSILCTQSVILFVRAVTHCCT